MNNAEIHSLLKGIETADGWQETMFEDVHWYDAGEGLFVIRLGHQDEQKRYVFIPAKTSDEAIGIGVFGMRVVKKGCVSVDLTIEKKANGEYVCTGRNPETMHEVKSSERGSMSAAISSFAHECGIQTELVKDR